MNPRWGRQAACACASVLVLMAFTSGAANAQTGVLAGPGYAEADLAYKAADKSDYAEAVVHAKAAVAAEPGNRDYRRLLITALLQAGRSAEADTVAAAAETQFGADAQISAQQGYDAVRRSRPAEAADRFTRALSLGGLEPAGEHAVRLSLADAALQAGKPSQALDALAPIASEKSFEVQSRRAFAYAALNQTAEAAATYEAALPLAAQPADKALMARGQIYSLVLLKRIPEAHAAFEAADRQGLLEATAPGDSAMLALAVGEDARALALFQRAREKRELTPQMSLDAAYAALRLEQNEAAVADFRRALDAADRGELKLSETTSYQVRRAVADLDRRWGGTVSAFYGSDGVSSATLVGGRDITQIGMEAYVRPALSGPASRLQIFARAFETVNAGSRMVGTGSKTAQAWIGVSAKPIRSQNFVLEASRMVKLGDRARDDWMLRTAYSAGNGLDLRPGLSAWPTWQVYVEGARIVDLRETLLYGDLRGGRMFRVPQAPGLIVGPFVGATYSYDNKQSRRDALAAGPGLMLRKWFNESRDKAPHSYVEVVAQYRLRVAGDTRTEGWLATLSYGF